MAQIIWSQEAERDLRAIREYIGRDSVVVADRIIDTLVAATERLVEFPLSGRVVAGLQREGVREIIITPYHIAYHL